MDTPYYIRFGCTECFLIPSFPGRVFTWCLLSSPGSMSVTVNGMGQDRAFAELTASRGTDATE